MTPEERKAQAEAGGWILFMVQKAQSNRLGTKPDILCRWYTRNGTDFCKDMNPSDKSRIEVPEEYLAKIREWFEKEEKDRPKFKHVVKTRWNFPDRWEYSDHHQ